MTSTLTRPDATHGRSIELVLAHAHLRLGSLALARTELETLAGIGKLDTIGLIDLAEVRWRTGDLAGAGEAAAVALRGDEEHPVALLIAAEAAASLGRPSESRRLAARAMACATGSIDAIFAGMPRSAAWPPDADEPPPTAPTLFDRAPDAQGQAELNEAANRATASALQAASAAEVAPALGPMTLGLWKDDVPEEPGARDLPEPARELEAGRTALVAGRFDEAVLRFGLALRLAPALAPAVLEATAGARASGLLMVRGDAYRLAGHEDEAREAYLAAARGGLPERRRRSRTRPAKTEAGATEWTDGSDVTPTATPEAGAVPPVAEVAEAGSLAAAQPADDAAEDPAAAADPPGPAADDAAEADTADPSAATLHDPPA
jgi:tetratricopeptide (TPR) repeat protein